MPNRMIPPQQTPQQPMKKQSKFKKSWIVLILVVVVFIIFLVVKGLGNTGPEPTSQLPESSSMPQTSMSVESEPIIQTTSGALDEIAKPKESSFTETKSAYIFNRDLVFSGSSTLADENVISIGKNVCVTPMKSCLFKFTTNKIDISHSSGTVMSIQRSCYRDAVNYNAVDKAITDNLAEGLAGEITFSDVYLGSTKRGRSGSAQIKIDEKEYFMSITYLFASDEVVTVVALSEPGDEDFIDILYRNITISGQKLTIA